NDGEDNECGDQRNHGRQGKDPAIRAVRNNVFFQQQLDGIGNRLKQSPGSDAHRAQPYLHEGDDLAFRERQSGNQQRQDGQNQRNLDERDENEIDRKFHYLSISPSTISSVPMMATTSATM